MHPALSVIVFTTASGAGYGLLALLGILAPLGLVPAERWLGVVAMGLALALIAGGLLSSTAHLGRPERAWRALSQWRTSWLSREGVVSLATFVPAGLFALGWVIGERTGGLVAVAGLLAAAGAVVTVWCTAMIYASLKPIQRWSNGWTAPVYLALALATGAVLLVAILRAFGVAGSGAGIAAAAAVALAWAVKVGYWRFIDASRSASTVATATGLGRFGTVRMLDHGHSEENYLMKEMGFRVARRHAARLRLIVHVAAFAIPIALSLIAEFAGAGAVAVLAGVAAAASALVGVLVERWLFFAEAKHTVTLYYGAQAA